MKIEDKGQGFAPNTPNADRKGLGIVGMQERVDILGGTFDLASELGKGTRITISVPIEEDPAQAEGHKAKGTRKPDKKAGATKIKTKKA
jgi:glucose-6-phosphate-specific signal transduction histidine kinase